MNPPEEQAGLRPLHFTVTHRHRESAEAFDRSSPSRAGAVIRPDRNRMVGLCAYSTLVVLAVALFCIYLVGLWACL